MCLLCLCISQIILDGELFLCLAAKLFQIAASLISQADKPQTEMSFQTAKYFTCKA